MRGQPGLDALDEWLTWAAHSSVPEFTHLADRIAAIHPRVEATITHGLSNALVESVNTKIRLITRVAFGFRTPEALIALAMLGLGGHPPQLPGRNHPRMSQ